MTLQSGERESLHVRFTRDERILPGAVVHLEPRPTVGSRDEMLGLPPMPPPLDELCRRMIGD